MVGESAEGEAEGTMVGELAEGGVVGELAEGELEGE